ncbi:MAG: hypothetical protein U0234_17270 [Sandaracinus sp.]
MAVAQSRAASDAEARALALFEQSATAYHEGRFADAAALLQEAYTLHPEPVLLYNRARALDAEGDLAGALADYRHFLEASPDAEQAPLARRRVEVLGAQLEERERHERELAEAAAQQQAQIADEPPADAPPPAASRAAPDLLAPGLVLGVGLAAAVAGSVVLGLAVQRHDDAVGAPIQADAARLDREALTFRDAGAAVLGVGAAVAVGAAVWMAVAATSSGSGGASAAIRIGPGSISVSGTF